MQDASGTRWKNLYKALCVFPTGDCTGSQDYVWLRHPTPVLLLDLLLRFPPFYAMPFPPSSATTVVWSASLLAITQSKMCHRNYICTQRKFGKRLLPLLVFMIVVQARLGDSWWGELEGRIQAAWVHLHTFSHNAIPSFPSVSAVSLLFSDTRSSVISAFQTPATDTCNPLVPSSLLQYLCK